MNESLENSQTPEHKMYENAINSYPDFVIDLQTSQDLEDIIDTLHSYTFVDGGAQNEHIFFEVIETEGEPTEVTPFATAELEAQLREFINDAPTEAKEIDMKIKHSNLNQAVKRVLGITA